jgi:hypothetical protein
MKLIKCPETLEQHYPQPDLVSLSYRFIFGAGGITGCPKWQSEMAELLKNTPGLVLFDPRRDDFDAALTRDPNIAHEQVEWEYYHLNASDAIYFWFPAEGLCSITLYELGKWGHTNKHIMVGCHPDYVRRFDVVKQLSLSRPDIVVVSTLKELAQQVKDYVNEWA